MPGVIMENRDGNGSYTNHDRDHRPNGTNGVTCVSEKPQEKTKCKVEPQPKTAPMNPIARNGMNGSFSKDAREQGGNDGADSHARTFDLPPELEHVVEHYISQKMILARLARRTHSDLYTVIQELSQMPVPASATNGNSSLPPATGDTSTENLDKKAKLLGFLKESHESWTKALVISGWSKNAEEVSRIVDLSIHLQTQRKLYVDLINKMADDKRELLGARLLNPDLKTAVAILTTGKASWMPDLNYIQAPPLTAKEILKWTDKLNTLLSMRLNLSDYDSIPVHFKDYTIASGRVTFKIDGEFEVDLTIADEEPESQFWFIDFRFIFTPSVSVLGPQVRFHIESTINEALRKDGLLGCYKVCHEMTLTHKISEYRRQSSELARGKWIETLGVEPLNRSLSIEYWKGRKAKKAAKNWFIIGVGGPKRKTNLPRSKASSHLYVRWFRDGKEVNGSTVPLESANVSAEKLLKTIIGRHSAHILTSLYEALYEKPLYSSRELGMDLQISKDDSTESVLTIQLSHEIDLSVRIQPITGKFVFSPASAITTIHENRLNFDTSTPALSPQLCIEQLRSNLIIDNIRARGVSVGWGVTVNPGMTPTMLKDQLKDSVKKELPKDIGSVSWLRRSNWDAEWHLAIFVSMNGEKWVLLRIIRTPETTTQTTSANTRNPRSGVPDLKFDLRISECILLPIKAASPTPTYRFMSSVNIFTAGIISHYANLKMLNERRCSYILHPANPSKAICLPSIYIRLSNIVTSANRSTGSHWAYDAVRLTFQGLETVPPSEKPPVPILTPLPQGLPDNQSLVQNSTKAPSRRQEYAIMIVEARMTEKSGIKHIRQRVDQDIAFDETTGSFAFRLRSEVGKPVINMLIEFLTRVERLVSFVRVLEKHERAKTLELGTVSLGKIVFRYGIPSGSTDADAMDIDEVYRGHTATIDFTAVDNVMKLILERDNPHLRIVDQLTQVLNYSEGLDGMAALLPMTLPVLQGFCAIEIAWTSPQISERGQIFVNVRHVDCYILRYEVRQLSAQNSNTQPITRKIKFEVKLRSRKGVPWWAIRRRDNVRDKEPDSLEEALKPLWNSSEEKWRGMRVSAVAEVDGVKELLEKLDGVMQAFVMTEESVGESIAAQVQAATAASRPANPAQQPRAPVTQQQQQRQQLHTPAQSQSYSQGRNNNNQMRSGNVIEID